MAAAALRLLEEGEMTIQLLGALVHLAPCSDLLLQLQSLSDVTSMRVLQADSQKP